MASVEELPNKSPGGPKRWRVRFYDGTVTAKGRYRQLSRTFEGTKREALAWGEEQERLGKAKKVNFGRDRTTLGELLDEWLKVAEIEPSTRYGYESKIKAHIRPQLGKVKLRDLDVKAVQDWMTAFRAKTSPKTKKPYGDATIKQCHAIIRAALEHGVAWGWVSSNPVKSVKAKTPKGKKGAPSVDVVIAVLKKLEALDGPEALGFRIAIATGARRGELAAMRWEHVDWKGSSIRIAWSKSDTPGSQGIKSTKTHADRPVFIDADTLEVLRKRRGTTLRGFILAPGDPEVPIRTDRLSRAFTEIAQDLEIPFRLHDLRHAHGTMLVSMGVPIPVISDRLGHANKSTTMRYLHAEAEGSKIAADLFGEKLAAARRSS